MSSRKRKAQTPPKDGPDAIRVERKRVQNRISQKCHRERQAAHARHLKSVIDIMKTGDQAGDDEGDRYSKLLQQYMKVVEEKRELEEAVFRMRKKLLSISSSAAAAADDEAVDTLVRSKSGLRRQLEPDPLSYLGQSQLLESISEESSANVEALSQFETKTPQNFSNDQTSAIVSSLQPQPVDFASSNGMSEQSSGAVLTPVNWVSDSEQLDVLVGNVVGQQQPPDASYTWSLGLLELAFPSDRSFSIPMPKKTMTLTSSTVFAEAILHACRKCGRLRTSEFNDEVVISQGLTVYGKSKKAQDMTNIAKISAIGVHLLTLFSGLEQYIYGVGVAPIMESILQWRIMPSLANHIAIPEPFRPTRLQCSTNNYPHTIDFFNWPAIRDQLILQSRNVDLDEITQSLVQNTVVEIPYRRMCVSVLSLFYHSILDCSKDTSLNNMIKSSITCSQWKFLEIPAPPEADFISPNVEIAQVESIFVQEISRRMNTGTNVSSLKEKSQSSIINSTESLCGEYFSTVTDNLTRSWSIATPQRYAIVRRFGLDQPENWKLSKEFARKYPFLDCSSAVSAYDMVTPSVALEA